MALSERITRSWVESSLATPAGCEEENIPATFGNRLASPRAFVTRPSRWLGKSLNPDSARGAVHGDSQRRQAAHQEGLRHRACARNEI